MSKYVVCALYKFVTLENYQQIKPELLQTMQDNNIVGTLLLAKEGINGTVAGSRGGIDALLSYLNDTLNLAPISFKESFTDKAPFKRTKVKLKKEIVTMGVEGIDPKQVVGTYVKPQQWNELISDPDVLLIDTRNDYEIEIGTFKGAINPNTDSFREFPQYVADHLDPQKHKKVAMFCTGGIRCEKSTAYLKEQGFDQVYHLEGGILQYLEDVDKKDTMWQGDCFVFDDRVAVNHDLEVSGYDQCHACRLPITEQDKLRDEYQKGVSCHRCYDQTSEQQRARYAERQRQMMLAKTRGEQHIGGDVHKNIAERKAKKQQRIAEQQANSVK
ncbi:rhodanese-related sulfurtransferase [Thalassotalea ponticola]|uniref:oxygen-dependent tRNA uridine(34) hydroxylase TrhO n=1 Tax=Thalassotalea ponticola TaxID=1523392 RepID=UPI0025B3FDD2|nr:rhodanese-related sulfurtransferase [Thalassotalea ponticola]MDN3652206.1 rhodanese-related sulfurtransferase [Thalassotalea ponticola]